MSKKAEILHKLSTDDRVYLSEKFKEKDAKIAELQDKLAKKDEEITKRLRLQDDEFLEERKQLKQQIADLEAKLAESELKVIELRFKQLEKEKQYENI